MQCNEWFAHPAPRLLPRVIRWRRRLKNPAEVKLFTDGIGAIKVQNYAHCLPDELLTLIRYHTLEGTEHLVDNPAYAFKTRTGCGMICRIETEADGLVKYGTLYFGIDRAADPEVIYHLFFEEQNSIMREVDIIAGPRPDPSLNTEAPENVSQEKSEFVGTYIKTISEEAVIQIRYPRRHYSIFIYPIDTEPLTPGLFRKGAGLG